VKTAIVKADEITLELLAKTTFELKRLKKYKNRNEFELIPVAHGFLDFCKAELVNCKQRKIALLANDFRKDPTIPIPYNLSEWAIAEKEIAGSDRRTERLLQFFKENPDQQFCLTCVADENSPEGLLSLAKLKRSSVKTVYIPKSSAAFEEWDAQKTSEQNKRNRSSKKGSKAA